MGVVSHECSWIRRTSSQVRDVSKTARQARCMVSLYILPDSKTREPLEIPRRKFHHRSMPKADATCRIRYLLLQPPTHLFAAPLSLSDLARLRFLPRRFQQARRVRGRGMEELRAKNAYLIDTMLLGTAVTSLLWPAGSRVRG